MNFKDLAHLRHKDLSNGLKSLPFRPPRYCTRQLEILPSSSVKTVHQWAVGTQAKQNNWNPSRGQEICMCYYPHTVQFMALLSDPGLNTLV